MWGNERKSDCPERHLLTHGLFGGKSAPVRRLRRVLIRPDWIGDLGLEEKLNEPFIPQRGTTPSRPGKRIPARHIADEAHEIGIHSTRVDAWTLW